MQCQFLDLLLKLFNSWTGYIWWELDPINGFKPSIHSTTSGCPCGLNDAVQSMLRSYEIWNPLLDPERGQTTCKPRMWRAADPMSRHTCYITHTQNPPQTSRCTKESLHAQTTHAHVINRKIRYDVHIRRLVPDVSGAFSVHHLA